MAESFGSVDGGINNNPANDVVLTKLREELRRMSERMDKGKEKKKREE